jgi:CRP/FNR family cyclic AMP-dependent transcriptional regulator
MSTHVAELGRRLLRWPFFRELGPVALEEVLLLLQEEAHPAGQVLLRDGDVPTSLYLLSRGLASHGQVSAEGREHVLRYPGPGQFLNLVPVLDGGKQVGTVSAVTDVQLYRLSAAPFLELCRVHSDVALACARALAAEVRHLSVAASRLALDPVRRRLAEFLLNSAEIGPAKQRWTQEMIASRIGTVRDVVGRILRDFAREGIVNRERGQLVIMDRERLLKEAGRDGNV